MDFEYFYYIHDFNKQYHPFGCGVKKYWFKEFKEYWEYRKLNAMRLDVNLQLSGAHHPKMGRYIRTNYSDRYFSSKEECEIWKTFLDSFIEIEYINNNDGTFSKKTYDT